MAKLPLDEDLWHVINKACSRFGRLLLKEPEEATDIFDAIMKGPSKQDAVKRTRRELTEDEFLEYRDGIIKPQLEAFEPLLHGKYADRLHELKKAYKGKGKKRRIVSSSSSTQRGSFFSRSPYSLEQLKDFSNEELLTCINEWNEDIPDRDGDFIVDINMDGFAQKFKDFFKTTVAVVKEKKETEKFTNFSKWLVFSEWVLAHTDKNCKQYNNVDREVEYYDWLSARSAVCDLIGAYIERKVKIELPVRKQINKILAMLCTQRDNVLEDIETEQSDELELMDMAINNTRSRALMVLVEYEQLARKYGWRTEISTMKTVLDKRLLSDAASPLTLPEHTIMGMLYPCIYSLDKKWAVDHKNYFFPQNNLPAWLAAFEGLIGYSKAYSEIFTTLQEDFHFALQHLDKMRKEDRSGKTLVDLLGSHLFIYYSWGLHPIKGEDSLLEKFYQKAGHSCWNPLFTYAGRYLQRISSPLKGKMKRLVIDFFDWRYDVRDEKELEGFLSWLEASHLDSSWKLEACSKVLDIYKMKNEDAYIWITMLHRVLINNAEKVIECLAKIVNYSDINKLHLNKQEARDMLTAGLASSDENTKQLAKQVRQRLFDGGWLDASDMEND